MDDDDDGDDDDDDDDIDGDDHDYYDVGQFKEKQKAKQHMYTIYITMSIKTTPVLTAINVNIRQLTLYCETHGTSI